MTDHASLLTCPMCKSTDLHDVSDDPDERPAAVSCFCCDSRFTQEGIDALSHGEYADEPADPFEAMAG